MLNHPKMKYTFVGVDSHKDTHCAFIINCFFEKIGTFTIKNAPNEFDGFLEMAKKYKSKGTTLIFGFEDVSDYGRQLVSFLLKKKFIVKHVNSYLVAHERKSLNITQKTDEFDAECAARVLLNRFDSLPKANTQDKHWILKNLVTHRDAIVKSNMILKNRLHSLLASHYPSYDNFFSSIDTKGALAFYEKYPSPSKIKDTTATQLHDFLTSVSGKGNPKDKAQKILDYINEDGDTTIDYQDIRDFAVMSVIKMIRYNNDELSVIEEQLEELLEHFEYKLTSIRGVSTAIAAGLISEIGDISRFSTPAKLARYSGIAPVTIASGRSESQFADTRGNKSLHHIFYSLAVSLISISHTKKARNIYFHNYFQRKISEGKTKRQALNCLQRRLVNIVWGMMTFKTEYINPELQVIEEPEEKNKSIDKPNK
jgi:transposase